MHDVAPGRLLMRVQESDTKHHVVIEDSIESSGRIKVAAAHGLSATVARSVVEVSRGFRASATLTAYDGRGRGHRADGRNLLELLLLGAVRGEAITLECVGDDAKAAFQGIAAVLGQDRTLGSEEVE